MHDIETQEMSNEFLHIWQDVGNHLNNQVDGGIQSWIRANPYPPFLEHLSFRLGNQLFFIRIEDVDHKVDGPGSLNGLLAVANGMNGHACLLPVKKKLFNTRWTPEYSGWGIISATTRKPIDPVALITTEDIEMTAWELQDMAVQVVKTTLEKQGFQIMSWQGNPALDPAIWFVGGSKKPEWVVVRHVKFPENQALRPNNWQDIANQCSRISRIGHFASVGLVSSVQPFESQNEPPMPLLRGHGMHIQFSGLD